MSTLARRTREHALQVLTAELGAREVVALERRAREWGVRAEVVEMVDLAREAVVRAGELVELARHVAKHHGRPDLAADLDFWPWQMFGASPHAEGGRPRSDLATFADHVSPDDRTAALAWVAWGEWECPARATGTPAKLVDAVRRAVKKTRSR